MTSFVYDLAVSYPKLTTAIVVGTPVYTFLCSTSAGYRKATNKQRYLIGSAISYPIAAVTASSMLIGCSFLTLSTLGVATCNRLTGLDEKFTYFSLNVGRSDRNSDNENSGDKKSE